jgi:hypothetical protein
MRRAAVIAAAVLAAGTAHADEPRIDWAKGLVTATGIGIADRHAPTPAAARGPSRRAAEDAARKRLAAALPALPLAAGGTLKAKMSDPQLEARVARAVEAAIVVEADPETDGSWKVTMAVPIEAVRQAIAGPRTLAVEDGPAVVVVDGVGAKPAVGWMLGALAAPTIWVKELPAWAKDAPRVKAREAKRGVIELDTAQGTASTLFVIVTAR